VKIVIQLCAALFCLFIAVLALGNVYKAYCDPRVKQFAELVEHPDSIQVLLDSTFETTVLQIGGVNASAIYTVTFPYTVDGHTYRGSAILNKEPTIPILEIYYLRDNPRIYAKDPKEALDNLSGRWVIVVFSLIGLAFLAGFLASAWALKNSLCDAFED